MEDTIGDLLGKEYVSRHFPPEAKRRMNELVGNLLKAFEVGIGELDWMGTDTRQAALEKIRNFTVKIAYPDKWKEYPGSCTQAGRPGRQCHECAHGQCPARTRQDRPARRQDRMDHDAADRQCLLQSTRQRDRFPGRDPAAAFLRHEGRRRGQLRWNRRRDRPRNQPRLRRPGPQVRCPGRIARLVDGGR